MKKNLNTIISIFVIIILIIVGFLLLRDSKPEKILKQEIKTENKDHILGNKEASIKMITYSDTQCPYCKMFYGTMMKILEEKGNDITWIYRHYPIPQLHPSAPKDAEAQECVFEQGGEDAFWKISDELYLGKYENDNKKLTTIVEKMGLDVIAFSECLETERYKEKVQNDIKEGNKAKVTGTPTSIILVDGKIIQTIPGALPYEKISLILDSLISN